MTLSYTTRKPIRHDAPPLSREPAAPTGVAGLASEWRTVGQLPRIALQTPKLRRAPRGDGRNVMDIPGWRSPEAAMAPLRHYLRSLGYDARGWGLGTNRGNPERDSKIVASRLASRLAETGEPTALVGWSLGGVVAREAARLVPEAVSQVVTFGTPVVGGPTYTVGAGSFGAAESARIAALIDETDRDNPIRVPITAIFTRGDAVVDWAASIDRRSADVTHIEVHSTHLGLTLDPDVWLAVASALGERG